MTGAIATTVVFFPLMRALAMAFLHAGAGPRRGGVRHRARRDGRPMHLETVMTKKFSLDEANRMLPLVSRIVRDIIDHYREWQRTVEAFEIAATLSRSEKPTPEAEALQHRAQELARDIQGFVGELSRLGLEFKGFELGLVDFPADVEGRNICWCWKHGEATVRTGTTLDAGYSTAGSRSRRILRSTTGAHHD